MGEKGLLLTITNTTASPLKVALPSGTIFVPDDDSEQTLMNVEEELIVLNSKETKSLSIDGYCINLNKVAPSLQRNFKIQKNTNANLVSLLDNIHKNSISKDNYQSAIWAVTDDEDIAYIEPINKADEGVRELIAKMTNRVNPWYTKDDNITALPSQAIERNSTTVEGILSFTPDKDMELYVTVEDKDNENLRNYPGMEFLKGWESNLKFKLSVTGWEKGDYTATIRNKATGESVKTFNFKV